MRLNKQIVKNMYYHNNSVLGSSISINTLIPKTYLTTYHFILTHTAPTILHNNIY